MNKPKSAFIVPLLFIASGIFFSRFLSGAPAPEPAVLDEVKLFAQMLGTVSRWYAGETKSRPLFYSAAKGLFSALDGHSEFIEPDRFKLLMEQVAGQYAGIGTELQEINGSILINSIEPGSVAEKAGLSVNDKILSIDGLTAEGKPVENITSLIHGDPNTTVVLSVQRRDTKEIYNLELMREMMEVKSVDDVRMIGKAIGYFRINHFRENTIQQVDKALDQLEKQKMKALIIDLRDNSGGVLERAVELSERFLTKGKLIVSVVSKIKEQNKSYKTKKRGKYHKIPMIVLVNQQSASAAEIFAAAMQDHDRADIIGNTTYGKASAQSIIPMMDGAGMKLTTARYLRPSGQIIDETGIIPDHRVTTPSEGEPLIQTQTKFAVSRFREYL